MKTTSKVSTQDTYRKGVSNVGGCSWLPEPLRPGLIPVGMRRIARVGEAIWMPGLFLVETFAMNPVVYYAKKVIR